VTCVFVLRRVRAQATLRKLFPQIGGPLTERDAWAATFEHLITDELRSDADCPKTLPDVPPPPSNELQRQLDRPIDEHAEGLIRILCQMNHNIPDTGAHWDSEGCGANITTYREFAPWVTAAWQEWMDN